MKNVLVLGSTGSIGAQTLDVVKRLEGFQIVGLCAGHDWKRALGQAKECGARFLALADERSAESARREKSGFGLHSLEVFHGDEGILRLARMPESQVVVHAIPGFSGIAPLLASLEVEKHVAFAGKEALVTAGDLVSPLLDHGGCRLIPVDSEHSAIFQSLVGEDWSAIKEIILTASGGALRDMPTAEMMDVTAEEVLQHPTWRMGRKVTVDSASLFNKALEVIEAHHLFGVDYKDIKVVIHRESIVHSMVTFIDGSTKAQAGLADMRLAISYGLTYPKRHAVGVPSLEPYLGRITFEEPDTERFPCLTLGHEAGSLGGTAPCVLSAADEVLVAEFLSGRLSFPDIYRGLRRVLDEHTPKKVTCLSVLEEAKVWAETKVREFLT